jgi:NifU-like protein involved in Fe-S cluster formation
MASVSTLYTRDILRLASGLPVAGRLTAPDGEAERRSVTCGSRVVATVRMEAGRLAEAALEAHSCALGQASAAIVLTHAAGMSHADITDLCARLAAGLNGQSAWPTDWPELSHLEPACAYPARHAAILLPYDAIIAAIEGAD